MFRIDKVSTKVFEFVPRVDKRFQSWMELRRYAGHHIVDEFSMGAIFSIGKLLETTFILIIIGEELVVA